MAWPSYASIVAGGYGIGQDNDVERTPLDDGASRQEKRYRGAMKTRQVTGLLDSDADLVRFRAWADDDAHTWFAFTDTEDGTSRQGRVRGGAGGIRYRARASQAGMRRWEFTLELEGMD